MVCVCSDLRELALSNPIFSLNYIQTAMGVDPLYLSRKQDDNYISVIV